LADNALGGDEPPPLHRSATASSPQPPAALFAPLSPVAT
jgi:hypothetical protein